MSSSDLRLLSTFRFAEVAPSDDDESRGRGVGSPLPQLLDEHAEITERELQSHRERLKQRRQSTVASGADALHLGVNNQAELQRVVTKLMRELAASQAKVAEETKLRTTVEKRCEELERANEALREEIIRRRRDDAIATLSKPSSVTSPTVGARAHEGDASSSSLLAMSAKSFRIVKRGPLGSGNSQALAALTEAELHQRAALRSVFMDSDEIVRELMKALLKSWKREGIYHRTKEQDAVIHFHLMETAERKVITVLQEKCRYKLAARCNAAQADRYKLMYLDNIATRRAAQRHSLIDVSRELDLDSDAGEPPRTAVPVTPTARGHHPWYPAGSHASERYHESRSNATGVSPSAGSARRETARDASATPTPRATSPAPSNVATRGVSPSSAHAAQVAPSTTRRSASAIATRTSADPAPQLVGSPRGATSRPPSPQRRREPSAAVKKTIATMEALLQELQQWKRNSAP